MLSITSTQSFPPFFRRMDQSFFPFAFNDAKRVLEPSVGLFHEALMHEHTHYPGQLTKNLWLSSGVELEGPLPILCMPPFHCPFHTPFSSRYQNFPLLLP